MHTLNVTNDRHNTHENPDTTLTMLLSFNSHNHRTAAATASSAVAP
jgi:hypothetical protein